MRKMMSEKGFTLIELLLVVVVMGLMLAVIVPRGQRATIDAKYSLVRQNGAEVAKLIVSWAETELAGQDDSSLGTAAILQDYYAYLVNADGPSWIADTTGHFQTVTDTLSGRSINGFTDQSPSANVLSHRLGSKKIINPFTGLEVFNGGNLDTTNSTPGALCYGQATDNSSGAGTQSQYFGIVFQGVESVGIDDSPEAFFAGMTPSSLVGLRNGIFVARVND